MCGGCILNDLDTKARLRRATRNVHSLMDFLPMGFSEGMLHFATCIPVLYFSPIGFAIRVEILEYFAGTRVKYSSIYD